MEELKIVQNDINGIINLLQNKGDWNDIGEYLIEEGWVQQVRTYFAMGHKEIDTTYHKLGISLMMVNDLEVIIQYKKGHCFVINKDYDYENEKVTISLRFEDNQIQF